MKIHLKLLLSRVILWFHIGAKSCSTSTESVEMLLHVLVEELELPPLLVILLAHFLHKVFYLLLQVLLLLAKKFVLLTYGGILVV